MFFIIIFNQIGIGIISDLLLFIPSTFLVLFFRRIRSRRSIYMISPILRILSQLRLIEEPTPTHLRKIRKKSTKLFPCWCLFIAYSLSFIIIIASILLIIARGIEFGDMKVQKWLGSLVINFFSSVLLSQLIEFRTDESSNK